MRCSLRGLYPFWDQLRAAYRPTTFGWAASPSSVQEFGGMSEWHGVLLHPLSVVMEMGCEVFCLEGRFEE